MDSSRIGLTEVTARVGGEALLKCAAELGLAGVEPMIGQEDSEYLSWTAQRRRQFAGRAGDLGVLVPSVALGAFNEDAALIDAALRDRAVRLITRSLEFSHDAGAAVMLLCTFFKSHPDTPEKQASLLRVLQDVAPRARELGVTIALETPLDARQLAALVHAAGLSNVGVYYDVGNSLYLGYDVPAEIALLGPLIRAMHIKDTATMLGDHERRADAPAA